MFSFSSIFPIGTSEETGRSPARRRWRAFHVYAIEHPPIRRPKELIADKAFYRHVALPLRAPLIPNCSYGSCRSMPPGRVGQ